MNGVLALPTIRTPPGATVKLSGWDLSSTIRISAADAACARPDNNAMQAAMYLRLNLGIVKSPRFLTSQVEQITCGTRLTALGFFGVVYGRKSQPARRCNVWNVG